MTDERIKEIAYKPILEAWKVIHMTQDLKPDDDEKWHEYVEAHTEFCNNHDFGKENTYGYYLGMAIMAIVDEIAKENRAT